MKIRYIIGMFVLIMFEMLTGVKASANQSYTYSDHVLTIYNNDAMTVGKVSGYDGDDGYYTLSYDDNKNGWRYDDKVLKDNINTVVIKEGVTEILPGAFSDLSGLKSVNISDSVSKIGEYAFARCDNLESVQTGNGLATISYRAFSGDFGIKRIYIGKSLSKLEDYAFEKCYGLENIKVNGNNKSFKVIKKGLYDYNGKHLYLYPVGNGVKKPQIASGTNTIAPLAFAFSSAKKITIPKNVKSLSVGMFANCTKLSSISFQKSSKCEKTISQSLDWTNDEGEVVGAFYNCFKLKNIAFPDKFKSLSENIFYGCASLETVSFGKKFKGEYERYDMSQNKPTIGGYIKAIALKKIKISPKNKTYSSKAGVLFSKDKKILFTYPCCKTTTNYKLPYSVKTIKKQAFCDNFFIKKISSSRKKVKIEKDGIIKCSNLKKVLFGGEKVKFESQTKYF